MFACQKYILNYGIDHCNCTDEQLANDVQEMKQHLQKGDFHSWAMVLFRSNCFDHTISFVADFYWRAYAIQNITNALKLTDIYQLTIEKRQLTDRKWIIFA